MPFPPSAQTVLTPTCRSGNRARLWRGADVVATLACLCVCLAPGPARAAAKSAPWRLVTVDDGVRVEARDVSGRNLPDFRGTAVIDGGVLEILAVLADTARHPEWMAACMEARLLVQKDAFDRILYNRTNVPWPVSDRDTVLHTWVRVDIGKAEVWSHFESIRSTAMPPVDGVVRMPTLRGFYHLRAIDPGHTRVRYQVAADPGGMLPAWMARMSTRRLPYKTLTGLAKQVRKTRGSYGAFVRRFDPAQGGSVPDHVRLDRPTPSAPHAGPVKPTRPAPAPPPTPAKPAPAPAPDEPAH